MRLYLREDFAADLAALAPQLAPGLRGDGRVDGIWSGLARADAQVYRQAPGRRTVRLGGPGGGYFAKLHDGVGWREIAKNLCALKPPVLGARNEFVACRRLAAHGVPVPRLAAFGECGRGPARRRSFLVCDALEGFASLEELAGCHWRPRQRRRLAAATGALLAAMHAAGVHHRDCYAAHILVNTAGLARGNVELAVIDLHRARTRERIPSRWRRRDLAALLFSTAPLRLTPRDLAGFASAYRTAAGTGLADGRFWRRVERRAEQLRRRNARRGGPAEVAAARGEPAASVTGFAALGNQPAVPFRFDVDLGSGPTRARCVALLHWRPKREFTARATIDGRERLLSAFFGPWRAGRFHRALRVARCLAATGLGTDVEQTGRSAGTHVFVCRPPTGRSPTGDDVPALVCALARLHEHALRPLDIARAELWLRPAGACMAHWQVAPLGRPRRAAIERDLAGLIGRFDAGQRLVETLRRYAAARGWPDGRLRASRVRDHMANRGPNS